MSTKPDVAIAFGATTKDLLSKMQQAQGKMKTFGKGAKKNLSSVAKGFKVASFGAAGLVATLTAITKSASSAGSDITNLSQKANESTTNFQKMSFAAKNLGIEQSTLASIMRDTSKNMGEIISTGGGPLMNFFDTVGKKVNVTADDFRNLSSGDALQLYVDTLEAANVSQQDMSFWMSRISGDAQQLIPLLKNGGSELNRLSKEAEELGLILSEQDLSNLAVGDEQFNKMGDSIRMVKNLLGAALVPHFVTLSDWILEVAKNSGGFGEIINNVIKSVISGFGTVIKVGNSMAKPFLLVNKVILSIQWNWFTMIDNVQSSMQGFTNNVIGDMRHIIKQFNAMPLGKDFDLPEFKGPSKSMVETRKNLNAIRIQLLEVDDALQNPPGVATVLEGYTNRYAETIKRLMNTLNSNRPETETEEGDTSQNGNGGMGDDSLKKFREKHAAEEVAMEEHNIAMLELKRANEAGIFETEREFREAKKNEEKAFQNQLSDIFKSGYRAREAFAAMSTTNQVSTVLGGMTDMLSGVASSSKKMFKIQKAAALGSALIDAYKGIQKTYNAYPFPWNIPMTALHAATAFKNIQSIKNQKFGGGGGAPSSAPSSGGGAAASRAASGSAQQSASQQQAPQSSVMRVEGFQPGTLLTSEMASGIVGAISEHTRNGGSVVLG